MLEPTYLIAASAVVVPLLIHLLTRPRLKEREFPLVFLIGPRGRAKRFFRQPKDRMLLILRMALVVLGALVLARPSCDTFPGARGACAVVLDCSASMAAGSTGDTALGQAVAAAASLLESLPSDTDVHLLLLPGGRAVRTRPDAALPLVKEAAPGALSTTTWALIESGLAALLRGSRYSGDLYVFSDFRGYAGVPGTSVERLDGVRVHLAEVGSAHVNPHIRELRFVGGVPGGGATVRLEAELRGLTDPIEITLHDGDVESRRGVIASGQSGQVVSWLLPVAERTVGTAQLTLPESPLSLDDTVYVAWEPARRRRVLVVSARNRSSGWLVEQALTCGNRDVAWQVRRVESADADQVAWEWADVVVWLAPEEPRAREPRRRILRFMGEDAGAGTGSEPPFQSDAAPMTLGRVAYEHPVFGLFARTPSGRMNSPLVFFHHRLQAPSEHVLAHFANGWPAVIQSDCGITVTTGLADDESDWAVRGSFVPFLWEVLSYLSDESEGLLSTVGLSVRRTVDPGEPVQIVGPRGVREGLEVGQDSTLSFVPEVPGFYRVLQRGVQVDVVAANIDPRESHLIPVDVASVRRRLRDAGADLGERGGEWWHVALAGMMVVLACETLLSVPR